jgi:hypothetical protein
LYLGETQFNNNQNFTLKDNFLENCYGIDCTYSTLFENNSDFKFINNI